MSLCEDFAGSEGTGPTGPGKSHSTGAENLALETGMKAAEIPKPKGTESSKSHLPFAAAASALAEALAPAIFDHRHRTPPSKGRAQSPLLRRRSEGRLKRVASVDDARSWSMSATARRDHLRDIVAHSYGPGNGNRLIPLPALFDALLADKNAEIDALRQRLQDKEGGDGGRRVKSVTCVCPHVAKVSPGDHAGAAVNLECEALMAEREALLLAALRRLDELQAAADGRDPRRTASEERFHERIRLKSSPSARAAAAAGRTAASPKRSPSPSAPLALQEGVLDGSAPAVTARSSCPSARCALQRTRSAEIAPSDRCPPVTSSCAANRAVLQKRGKAETDRNIRDPTVASASCPSVQVAFHADLAASNVGPSDQTPSTRNDFSSAEPPSTTPALLLQQPSPTVILQQPSPTVVLQQPPPTVLDQHLTPTQSSSHPRSRTTTPCASVRQAISSGHIVIKRSDTSKKDEGTQALFESHTQIPPPSPVPSDASLGALRGGAYDFLSTDQCPPCPGHGSAPDTDSCPCFPLPAEIFGLESTTQTATRSAPPRMEYSLRAVASEAFEEVGPSNAEALLAMAEERLENAAKRVQTTDSEGVAADLERETALAYREAALELLAVARSAVAERDTQKQALHRLRASIDGKEPPTKQGKRPIGGRALSAPVMNCPQQKIPSSVPDTTVMAFTVEYDLPECCRRGAPGCNRQQHPPPTDDCDCHTQNVAREGPCEPFCLAVGAITNVGGGGPASHDPDVTPASMNAAEAEAHAQLEQARRELAEAQRELEAARRCIIQLEEVLMVNRVPCGMTDMPDDQTYEVPDQAIPGTIEAESKDPVDVPVSPCPIAPCPGRTGATRKLQSSERDGDPGSLFVVPHGVISVDATNQETTVRSSSHLLAAQDLNAPPPAQSGTFQVSPVCQEVCSAIPLCAPCPVEYLGEPSHLSTGNEANIFTAGALPEVCSISGPCTDLGNVCPATGGSPCPEESASGRASGNPSRELEVQNHSPERLPTWETTQQQTKAEESCVIMESSYSQSCEKEIVESTIKTHHNGGLGLHQDTVEQNRSHISASGQITPHESHTGASLRQERSFHSGVETTQPSSGPGVVDPISPEVESRPCPPIQPTQFGTSCPASQTCPAKRRINPVRCSPHPSPTNLAPQLLPSTASKSCPARKTPSGKSCPVSRQPSAARLSPSGRSAPASRQPSPVGLTPCKKGTCAGFPQSSTIQPSASAQAAQLSASRERTPSPKHPLSPKPSSSPKREPSPKPSSSSKSALQTCKDDCYTRAPPPCVECPPGGSSGLSEEDREILAWAEAKLRSTDNLPERLRELRARALECDALCKRIEELESAAASSGMRGAASRVSPVPSRTQTAPEMPTVTSGVSPATSRLRPATCDLPVSVSGVSGSASKLGTPTAVASVTASGVPSASVVPNVPSVKSGVSPTASTTPVDVPVVKSLVSPASAASGIPSFVGSTEIQAVTSKRSPCPAVLSCIETQVLSQPSPEPSISAVTPVGTPQHLPADSPQRSNISSAGRSSQQLPIRAVQSSRKPCEDIVCRKVTTQAQEVQAVVSGEMRVTTQAQEVQAVVSGDMRVTTQAQEVQAVVSEEMRGVQTIISGEISMSPTLKKDTSTEMEPRPAGKMSGCQCELSEVTDFTCQCPEGEHEPSTPEPPYPPPDKDGMDDEQSATPSSRMQMELMALMEDRDAQALRAEALERERSDLHCRVAELSAEMSRFEGLEDEVDALRLEHEEMVRRLEEANTTEAALLDTVDRLAEAEEAAAEVLDLRQRVDDLEAQLAEARALLDEANAGGDSAERRALQEERDALLRLKCELECAIADQEDEIRRLTAALDRVAASAAGRQPSQTFRGGGDDDDDDGHSRTSASRTDATGTSGQSTSNTPVSTLDKHEDVKTLRSQLVASQAQVACLRAEVATLPALQMQANDLRERLDAAAAQLERVAKAQENASLGDQERSHLLETARVEKQRADELATRMEELQRHLRELEDDRSSSDALLQQVLDLNARLKMADAEHERAETLQAKLDILREEMALQAKQLSEQRVVTVAAVEVPRQDEVPRESVTMLNQRIMELQQLLSDTARERDELRRMTDSGHAGCSGPGAAAAALRCVCPSCGASSVCIHSGTSRAGPCALSFDPESEEGLRLLLVEAIRRARIQLARAAAADASPETVAGRRRLRALLEEHEHAMAAERARAVSPTRDRQRSLTEDGEAAAAAAEEPTRLPAVALTPAPHCVAFSPSLERGMFRMPPSSHDVSGIQQESKSLSRIEGHRGMAPGRIHQVAAAERPPSPMEGVAAAMALRSEVERALAQLWGSGELPPEADRRALSMAVFRRSEAFVSALGGAPIETRSEGQSDGPSHSAHGALEQRLYRVTEERDSLAAALAVAEEELGSMRLQKDADRKRLARQAHAHAEQVALLRNDPTAMLDASPAEEEMNRLQCEMDDLLREVARYRRTQEPTSASPPEIHQMQKELDELRTENETLRNIASQRRSDFTLDVTTAPATRARSVDESESSMEQYEKSDAEKHLTFVREERDMLSAKLRERDIQIQSLLLQKESDARRVQMIETHRADERWHRALEASGLVRHAYPEVNVMAATAELEEAVRANPELRSKLGGSVAEKTFTRAVDDLEDVIGQLRCDNVMLARRVGGSPVPPPPPPSAAPADSVDGDDVWALCRERERLEAAVRQVYDELGRVNDEKQTSEEEFENLLQANHDLLQEITFLKDWLAREGTVTDEDGNDTVDPFGKAHYETESASMPSLRPSSPSDAENQPSNDDTNSSFS